MFDTFPDPETGSEKGQFRPVILLFASAKNASFDRPGGGPGPALVRVL